jgi:regulator of sigma E protease
MQSFVSGLSTAFDLALVILGFTLIIVVHELGHYLAARWAKVRVLAFAVGFGGALCSYRRGLGFRRGSSESEYKRLVGSDHKTRPDISTCEWRLNAIPFGGYVKMLGQDDADPSARSDDPDSFQKCPVWKRMVIISAGVVFNIILAGILFVVVFTNGLKTEPPTIGAVAPDSPAATTIATNAAQFGVDFPGLRPRDRILSINGERPRQFKDVAVDVAMSRRERPVRFEIERPGVPAPLVFEITPIVDPGSRMLSVGIGPAASTEIDPAWAEPDRSPLFAELVQDPALAALAPARARLTAVEGRPATSPLDLSDAIVASGGATVEATFVPASGGAPMTVAVSPRARLDDAVFRVDEDRSPVNVRHLLGLMPGIRVAGTDERGAKAGLQRGDVFVQVGSQEWPSVASAIREIRASRASSGFGSATVKIVVLRETSPGVMSEVDLGDVTVGRNRTIGFSPMETADTDTLLAAWPKLVADGRVPSGAALPIPAGSRLVEVAGTNVRNFTEIRSALSAATKDAAAAGRGADVVLTIELPVPVAPGQPKRTETIAWTIPPEDVKDLHALGWLNPLDPGLFALEQTLLKADGPIGAVAMGVAETHRVMMMTYLTFARLFQGSVKVEHLRGPIGIAHTGTLIAERGFIWLLFFLGLISVNLAVINFLPIPITDGGHMIFLAYEQITGRPPPPAVFNIATLAGLVLIGTLFLIVTFNDIVNLFSM